ncbi:MAG: tRNA (N(6)-L-threonylcarbamoyladenosine(37)-C(2))-methylthiotransferase MtaB [Lentisphaeria bacterium]|nr:tRNA (N(6)-L-threonylcarbamoyladenosine(37)-C(2))-methylthiotransferase MtaB [Lentisphaeria bacterium]
MDKKAVVFTLGCRLNCADTALLISRLKESGYAVLSEEAQEFDLAVINSCAVTAEAVRKSRQVLRKLRKQHPGSQFLVTGCAAELSGEQFKADGADWVLTNPDKKDLSAILAGQQALNRLSGEFSSNFNEFVNSSFPFRSRAFVKIQEGCNNFCTYCIVPYVRGRERSRKFEEVLADCRQLVAAGYPELVLTGVNTCAYADDGRELGDLIRAVADIPGEFRIRLSSTEPHLNNRKLIDVMAETPKVCRFLHLSLQHGCDRILKLMNRHYSSAEYADFVAEARARIPGLHLGSDVIAGFPGETEEDHLAGLEFVKKMQFANLHVFTYSPRPGTPAAVMPEQVSGPVASRRSRELRQAGEESKAAFAASLTGQEQQVIFETAANGMIHGWSDNYVAFTMPENAVPAGRIVTVTATAENMLVKNPLQPV